MVGNVDDCEGWWWCDQWRTSQLTLPFLFVLSVGQPAGSPCRLDCLTCSSHLATYSITSPADRLLITHQSGLQARADCSCLIDTNWRVVTLCSFKNKCFYSRDSSVWLVISIPAPVNQTSDWPLPRYNMNIKQKSIYYSGLWGVRRVGDGDYTQWTADTSCLLFPPVGPQTRPLRPSSVQSLSFVLSRLALTVVRGSSNYWAPTHHRSTRKKIIQWN